MKVGVGGGGGEELGRGLADKDTEKANEVHRLKTLKKKECTFGNREPHRVRDNRRDGM